MALTWIAKIRASWVIRTFETSTIPISGILLYIPWIAFIASRYLIQLVIAEEHAGLLDGFSLLFLGGCGFYLIFEFTCKFHDENLRLKVKVKSVKAGNGNRLTFVLGHRGTVLGGNSWYEHWDNIDYIYMEID
ncbi:MAG: hypothetical protein IKS55_13705 [Oscillospiraceae bacterium]|nr:hypothetical protein [Oscillospiraceae bacterium]